MAIAADQQSLTFGEDIFTATLKAFNTGTIDIMVNNAGTANVYGDLEGTPGADFDRVFQVNVRGPFLLMQAALPHLSSPGGRILISSCVAKMGSSTANFYAGTKAALIAMSFGWAEQLGPKDITVNTVSPGPIDTDMVVPEEHPMMSKFRGSQNIKRNGTVAEVAEVIAFLCSPHASYITKAKHRC